MGIVQNARYLTDEIQYYEVRARNKEIGGKKNKLGDLKKRERK
jgi:hypothetical protein